MAVYYNRFWKLVIDKKISVPELRKRASISPNIMTKMRKDEMVSLTTLDKICDVLNVDFGDIIEHVNE